MSCLELRFVNFFLLNEYCIVLLLYMICQTSRTGTIAERHREDHTDAPNEAVTGRDPRCRKRPLDQASRGRKYMLS